MKFSSRASLLCVYFLIFANWETKTNGVSFTFVYIWFQFYPQVLLSCFYHNNVWISNPAGKLSVALKYLSPIPPFFYSLELFLF